MYWYGLYTALSLIFAAATFYTISTAASSYPFYSAEYPNAFTRASNFCFCLHRGQSR